MFGLRLVLFIESTAAQLWKEFSQQSQNLPAIMGVLDQDEIVISGISGRLPESDNLEEFWEHLMNKDNLVTTDDRRWEPGIHSLNSSFCQCHFLLGTNGTDIHNISYWLLFKT